MSFTQTGRLKKIEGLATQAAGPFSMSRRIGFEGIFRKWRGFFYCGFWILDFGLDA